MRHPLFFARTVLVLNNDIDRSIGVLNRVLGREGVIADFRRIQRYEKPWQARKRINFEKSKAIYNEDLTRKILFLERKNRTNPYPGCH